MQAKLMRGRILREMLKQGRLHPRGETQLLAWLIAYNSGLLDELDPHQARRHLDNLAEHVRNGPLTLDAPLEQWQAQVQQWWADSGGRHEQTA
jgi:F-type H+-transporting ATPase subunit alpha